MADSIEIYNLQCRYSFHLQSNRIILLLSMNIQLFKLLKSTKCSSQMRVVDLLDLRVMIFEKKLFMI